VRIVERYRDHPPESPIVALFDEGKFWLHEGHHRAAAAVERGDFSVPGLIFRREAGTAETPELVVMDPDTGEIRPYEANEP
jgi:hypothetical protein